MEGTGPTSSSRNRSDTTRRHPRIPVKEGSHDEDHNRAKSNLRFIFKVELDPCQFVWYQISIFIFPPRAKPFFLGDNLLVQ